MIITDQAKKFIAQITKNESEMNFTLKFLFQKK